MRPLAKGRIIGVVNRLCTKGAIVGRVERNETRRRYYRRPLLRDRMATVRKAAANPHSAKMSTQISPIPQPLSMTERVASTA